MPKSRHVPERSCVACGNKMPKPKLIRVVQASDGSIIVDTTGKESGRGAYLCHLPQCWGKALTKGSLQRSFKKVLSTKDLEPIQTYYEENLASQATVQ